MSRRTSRKPGRKGSRPNAHRGVMGRMYGLSVQSEPKSAIRRYRIFHKKDPREVRVIQGLPDHVRELGRALSVMYETDKWNDDGDDIRYKHLHENGVLAFEAAARPGRGTTTLPVAVPAPDEGFARLGRCLGFFVQTDDGKVREYNPRGTDLFSSPRGDLLGVYHPARGWVAFIAGGKLRVESEGIDG